VCRGGRALKLERIPTEILFYLVEQRGELVSREQIAERVWGKSVFRDTDNSINGAIRKIRRALKGLDKSKSWTYHCSQLNPN